ncbi:hypothetical protein PISMIDRAFT_676994 [Pisolithus microcarpus 441]|uniref:Uncharacterized protein n=1 Tax=Pisolithus microcarpus 441 TaxID=765257 RepID=A0A0C9YKZ8_9AGAM|nr:hypothetical protein PISMIDRAFT_676994 [Pisolithus microcarpus 441]
MHADNFTECTACRGGRARYTSLALSDRLLEEDAPRSDIDLSRATPLRCAAYDQ